MIVFFTALTAVAQKKRSVNIVLQAGANARMKFGVERLKKVLVQSGYVIAPASSAQQNIVIGEWNSDLFKKTIRYHRVIVDEKPVRESFRIVSLDSDIIIIGATDASGVLYGCLSLADQVRANKILPSKIDLYDQPQMVLRGSCIGLQKPYYLPGRTVYEYPYTPETFPWFYDKKLWIQVLDSMVENRMNSLYLWNGHPFASLVRLKDYPFAVEVSDETFKKNEEIYRFITSEADKRGIWVIQMFYNIIVSKPFAEHYKIKTQDRERHIVPLIADYTRKSIAAFVEKYPNVGLMVCLGEAMEGTGQDDIDWFTQTIIPGVQDGLKAIGKTEEPPIVLRAHDTDAPAVMKASLPLYKNLYTEAKFNGEALTTDQPRGQWAKLHQTLSRLGTVQIENVHIMANLEPFRYGATEFIQKCVEGMKNIMEGRGLHLYPQASYWDWPYTADSISGKRLLQIERDWIWYKAWSRYAWNSDRKLQDESGYWSGLLAAKYGCSGEKGKNILNAYEESGQIAPKLLRRFGITDGNRQTLTLGMLMTQLINPFRYGLFTLMYESESPEGEMLVDYAAREWNGEEHIGETPVQIIKEVKAHGDKAVAAIEQAAASVSKNKEEFDRLKNDMYCYRALAYHYALKTEAALYILRYKYSNDVNDLEKALPILEKSVEKYKELVNLTRGTYLYANSMQTQQRKIPMRGVNGTFKAWAEMVAPFEEELKHFKHTIDSLKKSTPSSIVSTSKAVNGVSVFIDTNFVIERIAKELEFTLGRISSWYIAIQQGTKIEVNATDSQQLIIGYFNSTNPVFLKEPELETNAAANDYGQAEIKIANAILIRGLPPVNIHTYTFGPGNHVLQLPKGVCLYLGSAGKHSIPVYDAGLTEAGIKKEIDWLFE